MSSPCSFVAIHLSTADRPRRQERWLTTRSGSTGQIIPLRGPSGGFHLVSWRASISFPHFSKVGHARVSFLPRPHPPSIRAPGRGGGDAAVDHDQVPATIRLPGDRLLRRRR